ncbi:trehalose-phosphatase [Jannaschia sp. Os4]|uniref:trehalose-phosphatase n=1 Tax=Jannaschia sp. Os4 TaxID=2807617 RepID=UPI00193998D3|nr:trehalose-phosphatase [Jannaschia sp. Os4]MBM2576020.1 trehalose-phosphatase [Jannaschia sp. Os4]
MQYYQMTGFMQQDAAVAASDGIALPDPAEAALFLDFDGSLVEIAARPQDVVVDPRVPNLLSRAMDRLDGRVGLVSGRSIEALEHFLPGFRGHMIGTHGAEFRVDMEWSQVQDFDLDTVARLQRLVGDFGALRPEFLVEPKPSGVVLHYRQAEELGGVALKFMEALACAADGFKLQPALMAYELKPDCVGKDVALKRLLARPDLMDTVPIYAGDDLTDEPALDLVQGRGGAAIKVGAAETVANHRLGGPDDLLDLLEDWLA